MLAGVRFAVAEVKEENQLIINYIRKDSGFEWHIHIQEDGAALCGKPCPLGRYDRSWWAVDGKDVCPVCETMWKFWEPRLEP